MPRVTDLRIRADWAFVRVAYLPALAAGVGSSKLLWPLAALSFRIAPCGICVLLSRWGNHIEEWIRRKPLFQITETGLRYEDGCAPAEYAWSDIVGIVMHRRNTIPPWRTNGSTEVTPPFWLSITVRHTPRALVSNDGYLDRAEHLDRCGMNHEITSGPIETSDDDELIFGTEGYVDRSRYLGRAGSHIETAASDDERLITICVWPRQVVGGLFSLMRFARELQRRLIDAADRGEIPKLLPQGSSA